MLPLASTTKVCTTTFDYCVPLLCTHQYNLHAGEPHYHVEVNKLKPMPLVMGIAAVLFATGSTLSSTGNVGRFLLNIHPLRMYSSSCWETTASVSKNRRQGLLQIHSINPLITL